MLSYTLIRFLQYFIKILSNSPIDYFLGFYIENLGSGYLDV